MKERITVTNWKPDLWTESHDSAVKDFLRDSTLKLMVAYNDQYRGFCIEYKIPSFSVDQLTYFIKTHTSKDITPDNFFTSVQYGTVKATHIESLLRTMIGIYAPIFFEDTSWPDSILFTPDFNIFRFIFIKLLLQL